MRWELVGEGNRNLVVRRRDIDETAAAHAHAGEGSLVVPRGKVLRLRKLTDARCDIRGGGAGAGAEAGAGAGLSRIDEELWAPHDVTGTCETTLTHSFAENVLRRRVCDEASGSVELEAGELVRLPQQMLDEIARDVCGSTRGSAAPSALGETALVLTDWTLWSPRADVPRRMGLICVELKPKCALLPSNRDGRHLCIDSVDPLRMHVLKYFLVSLHRGRHTRYDPRMLFFPEAYPDRRRCLEALIVTPCNNFRVSVDGRRVYPPTSGCHLGEERGREVLRRALETAIGAAHSNSANSPSTTEGGQMGQRGGRDAVDALVDTILSLLTSSGVLESIARVQGADRVDTVGALSLYADVIGRSGDASLPSVPNLESLPRAEKLRLLSEWSLSLWAKDCSIMLAFDSDAMYSRDVSTERNRKDAAAAVAVVDIDLKPASKAADTYRTEKALLATAEEFLGGGDSARAVASASRRIQDRLATL